MEWSKAKKYTIIILLILNGVLFCLNIYKGFETRLSSSEINALTSVLEKKNIILASPLPSNYKPMAYISASEYAFDYIKLEKIFMEGQSNVKRTDEYNSVVFMSDNSRLAIKGSAINYTAENDIEITNDADAKKFAQNIIDKINNYFGSYKFYSLYKTKEGYNIKFYEKTEGHNIFSNYAYFTIKGKNIALALNYVKTGSPLNEKNNIYAADEAIYSAAHIIAEENKKPSITNVELGYYVIKSGSGNEDEATPFYLIISNGKEYYVNAYTGECF